jgi:hypothetical protein
MRYIKNKYRGGVPFFIKAEGSLSQYIKGEFRSINANKVSHQEQEERGEKT